MVKSHTAEHIDRFVKPEGHILGRVGIAVEKHLAAVIAQIFEQVIVRIRSFSPAAGNTACVYLKVRTNLHNLAHGGKRYFAELVRLLGHKGEFIDYVKVTDEGGAELVGVLGDHIEIALRHIDDVSAKGIAYTLLLLTGCVIYRIADAVPYYIMDGGYRIIKRRFIDLGKIVALYADEKRYSALVLALQRLCLAYIGGVILELHTVAGVAGGKAVVGKSEREHISFKSRLHVIAERSFTVGKYRMCMQVGISHIRLYERE